MLSALLLVSAIMTFVLGVGSISVNFYFKQPVLYGVLAVLCICLRVACIILLANFNDSPS